MALLFPIQRMILPSILGPHNQREVLGETTTSIMMMTVFLLQSKLLRELHRTHLILLMVLVGLHVRRNPWIGMSLGPTTFATLVPTMFGKLVRVVVWQSLISGPSDGV
jgi:hypothetical protein